MESPVCMSKVSKEFVTDPSSHKLMQAIIVGLLAAIIL